MHINLKIFHLRPSNNADLCEFAFEIEANIFITQEEETEENRAHELSVFRFFETADPFSIENDFRCGSEELPNDLDSKYFMELSISDEQEAIFTTSKDRSQPGHTFNWPSQSFLTAAASSPIENVFTGDFYTPVIESSEILDPEDPGRELEQQTKQTSNIKTSEFPAVPRNWIRTVMELNAKLYDHEEAQRSSKAEETAVTARSNTGNFASTLHGPDQAFILSQRLLDLCDDGPFVVSETGTQNTEQIGIIPPPDGNLGEISPRSSSQNPEKSLHPATDVAKIPIESQSFPPPQDTGSILLLASCRVRVLEIYKNLLQELGDHVTKNSTNSQDLRARVPNLSIGKFSLGTRSLNLQIIMILQIMEDFLLRLQDESSVTRSYTSSQNGLLRSRPMFDIAAATLRATRAHEIEILQDIRRIRCMMNMS
ncbi:hypothetical protein TWF694_011110 [Orbilia ellipsospora]|uniref:Uncharacterized protein n=1 Tax=Orbilia ellipsospora TaxID=2528407 RepID=A0AAV9X8D0_9PEZI